jgi:thioesterase domain-containing protein
MRSGRRIAFLGLIDARRWLDPQEPRENPLAKTELRTIVRRPQATLTLFLPWLVERLAANYRFNAVRAVLLLTKFLPAHEATGVNLRLTHQLRREALRKLVLAPLDVPVVLFRSDLFRFYHVDKPWIGPHDYGWHGFCSGLTIVNVQGSHSEVWDSPYCQFLRERLVEAVEAARNRVARVGIEAISFSPER